jgi:tetratricopeptide (TPR) repeat protein/predicted Ser/Thr protein kinase
MTGSQLLLSQLQADQRARWQQGDRVRVEVYLAEHPQLRANPEAVLDLIYGEVVLRQQQGERPELAEYLERFGELDSSLRLLFEVEQALEQFPQLPDTPTAGAPPWVGLVSHEPDKPLPVVPGYEILAEVGRGGMGVVYRARHVALKRLVALKMVLAGAHAGPAERQRFRTEAEAVARLQHPNIVQIYEVSEHEGQPYVALEFVNGPSLEEWAAGTLPPEAEAARLVEALARAMDQAHQRGILHRDLKPANVLLGEEGTPRITDFGLARLTDSAHGLTPTDAVLGTPSYMAPEQAAGQPQALGPAADIYSLGAILYHLLTGRPPFKGATLLDTLEQVRTQEPVRPGCWRRLSRDLEMICLRCLEKDPRQRYATAGELADDLRRFLDGLPVQARPVSLWRRLARTARRPAVLARTAVLAAVLSLLAMGAWYLHVKDRLTRQGALEKYQAFLQHRDEAFFHRLLSQEQGALLSAPQAETRRDTAQRAAREALRIAGITLTSGKTAIDPDFAGPRQLQVRADCYTLLLILAELPGDQSLPDDAQGPQESLRLLDCAAGLGIVTRAYHLRRAQLLGRLDDAEGARQEEQRAAALPPQGAIDHFLIGEEGYRRGDWEGALAAFNRALAEQPAHFWAQLALAVCQLRLQRCEAARAGFTACLAQRELVWAYLFRSLANEQLGAVAEAEDDFQRALSLRPDEDARYALLLMRGTLRCRQKDWERAEADFQAALAARPDQYNAHVNLAHVYLARKELTRADEQMEQALRWQPPPSVVFGYHLERGQGRCERGDYAAALGAFDAARSLFPEHPLPERLRGRAFLELQRYAEAERSYSAYLRKGGEGAADVFRGRGLARMKLGRYPDAVDDYTRALDRQPDGEIYQHRGWAYFFSDAWRLALRDFDRAVELTPRASDAYTGRGLARVMLGHYREAVTDAETALRLGPQTPAMMHNIACIFAQAALRAEADQLQTGQQYRERAVATVRRTLTMLPQSARPAFWRDKVLPDPALAPIRDSAAFKQVERDVLSPTAEHR